MASSGRFGRGRSDLADSISISTVLSGCLEKSCMLFIHVYRDHILTRTFYEPCTGIYHLSISTSIVNEKHSTNCSLGTTAINLRNPDTHGPFVRLEAFNACQLFNSLRQPVQAIGCQLGTGDVFEERAQVDPRVLLRIAVGCCRG